MDRIVSGTILAVGAAVLISGCAAPQTVPSGASVPASEAQASASSPGSTQPPTACAGVVVVKMRVHITSRAASSGEVLDGSTVTGTYRLVWPEGYSIQAQGANLVVADPSGSAVAADGSILSNVQACTVAGALELSAPIAPTPAGS